ncbi:MAG: hypothetical protein DRP87_00580 [Spirochaetes bacterium]|mgnify:CR=1 FL=1|nr:MAG: hypothetical protein DRP87_00580 [Spirochaetota bacterium]
MGSTAKPTERIGEFLVRIGALTSVQADEVLAAQRKQPGKLFGELAIELGFINDEAVNRYLEAKDKGENLNNG